MSPDDPKQLIAFLKTKAGFIETYIPDAGTSLDGWKNAIIDAEIWVESERFREAVASDNAEAGLT